jgi:TPR repeat protein
VSELAAEAVYCPRCGLRLPPNGATPKGSSPSDPAGGSFSSTIARGYANAMFRLGVRYEVRHNEAEAVRCYGKASHLGNVAAKVCLLDIALSKSPGTTPEAAPPS